MCLWPCSEMVLKPVEVSCLFHAYRFGTWNLVSFILRRAAWGWLSSLLDWLGQSKSLHPPYMASACVYKCKTLKEIYMQARVLHVGQPAEHAREKIGPPPLRMLPSGMAYPPWPTQTCQHQRSSCVYPHSQGLLVDNSFFYG